ncbi:hypothetical protein NUW54_g14139 [Trametes sanguinea]|uniref:Uncharacterized protein n=1 Tax=Trametes sanguinea TaxID=158606 RepID=A0ACC1MEW3_9APHY|nr:hypothetical protein NUW54_g14139 [Trametes sanguinea]
MRNLAAHHILEDELGELPLELRDPAHAARPDHAPVRQLLQRLPARVLAHDQAVHWVRPLHNARNLTTLGERRRHILEAVHEHVHPALEHRDLEPRGPSVQTANCRFLQVAPARYP